MNALVSAAGVGRRFDDFTAVDGIDLEVMPGEIVGLLGANGAGKTTLIRMVLGLIAPTFGAITLFGGSPGRQARRRLGYMPQGLGLYDDLSVAENLRFASRVHGVAQADSPDLATVADAIVAELPLGWRRRVAFAAATCHQPDLLVLDEPTSGVGPLARAELWDTIHAAADGGIGVLVTTHYMDEAEQCDRLIVMAQGRQVTAGTVAEVTRGISSVEVVAPDTAGALGRLEEAGLVALPGGGRLRVPGADETRVREALAGQTGVRLATTPANLEEAFITLVAT